MSNARKGSVRGLLIVAILTVMSIAAATVFLWPKSQPQQTEKSFEDFDIVCTGRVDTLEPVTALEPVQPARVIELLVAEGDQVDAGQPLVRLDDESAKIRLELARIGLDAAKLEFEAAQAEVNRYPRQLEVQSRLLDVADTRIEAARLMLSNRKSQADILPFSQGEEEASLAKIRELEQLRDAENTRFEEMKTLDTELRVKMAETRVKAAETELQLAELGIKNTIIAAQTGGLILRLQTTPGALIAPGSPIPPIVFAPNGPLLVRGEIDQEFLGRVHVGMRAEIQDENQTGGPVYKGRLASMAKWVAMRRMMLLDPGELNDVRTVECVIEFDPPTEDFWIGQRVRVRLLLD